MRRRRYIAKRQAARPWSGAVAVSPIISGGGGGGASALLGPFPVTFADQAALEGDGLVLAQIPAGAVLLGGLCVLTELWAGVTTAVVDLAFGTLADWGNVTRWDILGLNDQNHLGAASWLVSLQTTDPIVFPPLFDPAGDSTHFLGSVPAIALSAVQLRASGFFVGAAVAGAVDIYAVVESP